MEHADRRLQMLRRLRDQYEHNLYVLLHKAARYGGEIYAPLEVQNLLTETRAELHKYDAQVVQYEAACQPVAPTPASVADDQRTVVAVAGDVALILQRQHDDWLLCVENRGFMEVIQIFIKLTVPPDLVIAEPIIEIPQLMAASRSQPYALGMKAQAFRIRGRVVYRVVGSAVQRVETTLTTDDR